MRRISVLLALSVCGCALLATGVHATITPTEALNLSADAEQQLVDLNSTLSDQYFHRGEFDHTIDVLDRIITLQPVGTNAYSTAAWLAWSAKEPKKAIAYCDRMIAANPNDAEAYFEYGIVYLWLKDDQNAAIWLGRAEKIGGLHGRAHHMYGIVLRRLGRLDEAIVFWQRVIAEIPTDDYAKKELASIQEQIKHPEQQPAPKSEAPPAPILQKK